MTTHVPRTAPAEARVLDQDELRGAHEVFARALHMVPADDDRWARLTKASYSPGRTFGIDAPGAGLVGTATSFPAPLTLPGGGTVPSAAVTRVGVRADHTRRGLLTALMRTQLRDAADRGEIVATLRASEARIYGRFGYGVATRGLALRATSGTALRSAAPAAGQVRLLTADEAPAVLPAVYERLRLAGDRPGALGRNETWWAVTLDRLTSGKSGAAVHVPDGSSDAAPADVGDGFATWSVRQDGHAFGENTLEVSDLFGTPTAVAGLWRFLLGVDLVRHVEARLRPLDEPLDLLVADPRAAATTGVDDETWLRLLDVPAALAARTWGDAEPVRIRVHDALFPANDTVHTVGAGPAAGGADGTAELECDVAGLAMAYLGDRRPSELVASGWWTAHDPAAVARADALFVPAGSAVPWCGTFF